MNTSIPVDHSAPPTVLPKRKGVHKGMRIPIVILRLAQGFLVLRVAIKGVDPS